MTAYDIIGDVHGSADKLEGLLRALGYDGGRTVPTASTGTRPSSSAT